MNLSVQYFAQRIFNITSAEMFNSLAIELFHYQYQNNSLYKRFTDTLSYNVSNISHYSEIPFLPIEFFKTYKIITGNTPAELIFKSSGTTGNVASTHYVTGPDIYKMSFSKGFELFYGSPENYCILALLPSYLERQDSSLVYMTSDLIKQTGHPKSGFYLNDLKKLSDTLEELNNNLPLPPSKGGEVNVLIGVSFALLELAEKYPIPLKNTIIMETGGMKGRRKELIRNELHEILCQAFHVNQIHSEYGMTELLSQAYSKGNGIFNAPSWMKILIRDTEDPLTLVGDNVTGGVNIIDLANINSCAFIATQDLGKTHKNGSFEIIGRFDNSDIRGCNLMVI